MASSGMVTMIDQVVAVLVVVVFALVNGVNDGGTVVVAGLRTSTKHPWVPIVMLVGALATVPLVGTRVSQTLAERLVGFEGNGGRLTLIAAVAATLLVVWVLTARGLPTSLTLGLVGAIAGAGTASRLPVDWGLVGFVLLVAAIAPAVGFIGAFFLQRALRPFLGPLRWLRGGLLRVGYLLQCLAYGGNDGQKILAVLAVVGVSSSVAEVPYHLWLGTVLAFAVGTLLGVARLGRTLSGGVLPVRSEQSGIAQTTSASAVLISGAFGSPVSLTQAVTAGLIGSGVGVTPRRVRWQVATRIAIAWAVTLPAAFVVSAIVALMLGGLL